MSVWVEIGVCTVDPKRDNQARIIWHETTGLSVQNADLLRRQNVLLMASKFDHVLQTRHLMVRVKQGSTWREKQARSLLAQKHNATFDEVPAPPRHLLSLEGNRLGLMA
tara:strand:- start:1235 stop:1561 length:327 start_codon:yes stop_codon:yes gene_type:complete